MLWTTDQLITQARKHGYAVDPLHIHLWAAREGLQQTAAGHVWSQEDARHLLSDLENLRQQGIEAHDHSEDEDDEEGDDDEDTDDDDDDDDEDTDDEDTDDDEDEDTDDDDEDADDEDDEEGDEDDEETDELNGPVPRCPGRRGPRAGWFASNRDADATLPGPGGEGASIPAGETRVDPASSTPEPGEPRVISSKHEGSSPDHGVERSDPARPATDLFLVPLKTFNFPAFFAPDGGL